MAVAPDPAPHQCPSRLLASESLPITQNHISAASPRRQHYPILPWRRFLQFPHLYSAVSRVASPLIYWRGAQQEQRRPTIEENTRPSTTPFRSNRPRSSIQHGLRHKRTELQNILRLAPAGPFVRPEGRLCWGESYRATFAIA